VGIKDTLFTLAFSGIFVTAILFALLDNFGMFD